MIKRSILPLAFVLLTLAACSPQVILEEPAPEVQIPANTSSDAGQSGGAVLNETDPTQVPILELLPLLDQQGAVVVEITPINLQNPGETLDFEVAMNTHSVNLDMNLVELAVLRRSDGQQVQAVAWNAPSGGHHISGRLSFPAILDGKPFLEDSSEITLELVDVDAPLRVFTWSLR